MTNRINHLLKYFKLTSSKFAEEIGVQKSSISHLLSGRNKPSLDFIQKLLTAFPEINSDWLILGKGEMIIEEDNLFNGLPGRKHPELVEKKENPAKTVAIEADLLNKKADNQEIKEKIIANKTTKATSKIVIFYTDNTFKEFYPND